MKFTPKYLKRWVLPDSYFGATWDGYYVAPCARHRDSDVLSDCNWEVMIEQLDALPDVDLENDGPSRQAVCERHWACGWVEWYAIHESDIEALKLADKMAEKLEAYPVLDDDALLEAEEFEADVFWKERYNWQDRIDYIRDRWDDASREFDTLRGDFRGLLRVVRGEYFPGYASELIY